MVRAWKFLIFSRAKLRAERVFPSIGSSPSIRTIKLTSISGAGNELMILPVN